MRRDVQYFYGADTVSVYNAFLTAAQNEPFERDCSGEPYATFSFGLNFSMKYNMNGGSCILNFFPTEGGTLVNLRFVVAQAFGARYERYAEDLTSYVNPILGISPSEVEFDVDELIKTADRITPDSIAATAIKEASVVDETPVEIVVEPSVVVEPVAAPTPAAAPAFCGNCGNKLGPNDAFCGMCGTKVTPLKRFCTECGRQANPTDVFCGNCGKKL